MKSISSWAANHKVLARICIVAIYVTLNLLGIFTGDLFHSIGIIFNSVFLLIALTIGITGLIFYPSKRNKYFIKNFYLKQKISDCLLVSATFLFIVYTGNSFNNIKRNVATSFVFGFVNTTSPLTKLISEKDYNKAPHLSKKRFRKNIRSIVKNIRKKYKESTRTEKTIYIILSVLGAGALIYLLAGLACSIACSGSEALAYIVFFVGLGAIIFGLVRLIQRISRGKPNKEQLQTLR